MIGGQRSSTNAQIWGK